MDHKVDEHSDIQATAQAAAEMRAEAVEQLKSARDLAKRVRAEAMHELEDARERVARIAAREEEMAERWAALLEAENALKVSQGAEAPGGAMPAEASAAIAQAQAEAQAIIAKAHEEAGQIREQAMHLLAIAEGEKAESHQIAQSETERATAEAERLRAEAAAEAQRLRDEAEVGDTEDTDASIYSKRRGRKLPRIGDSANNLLSEMSGLRARSAEEADRQVS
jgi:hypothetical protein